MPSPIPNMAWQKNKLRSPCTNDWAMVANDHTITASVNVRRYPRRSAIRPPQDVEEAIHHQKRVNGQSVIPIRQGEVPPHRGHDHAQYRAFHVVEHRTRKQEQDNRPAKRVLPSGFIRHVTVALYYIRPWNEENL